MLLKYKSILAAFLVFVSAFGFWYWRDAANAERVRPQRGDVIESIYGLATVLSDDIYNVRVGSPMPLQKLYVKEGDWVHKGDPLLSLGETRMLSQIEGTVTMLSYKTGELVPPQVNVLTVTNLQRLYLEVSLEQQSILRVKKGQNVAVSFESLRSEKFEGEVISVYPRANQFIVRIEIKKWPAGVLPGMTADVAILVGKKSQVLLIPIKAIVGGKITMWHKGKKERVAVQLGVVSEDQAELLSDNITEEDEILIRKR